MRILILSCPFRDRTTLLEIDCYLKYRAHVMINVSMFTPYEKEVIHGHYGNCANLSFSDFDSEDPDALAHHLQYDAIGFDAVICRPALIGLTPELLKLVAGTQTLIHRLRAIGCANDSISHLAGISDIARQCDVVIVHTPGMHAEAVAEYVVSQLVFHSRKLGQLYEMTGKHGDWPHEAAIAFSRMAKGKVLGVVGGSGKDGSAVISLAKKWGFGVLGMCSGQPESARRITELGASAVTGIEKLVASSDFLSINCRATKSTIGLIGTREIEMMNNGVIIIDCSAAEIFNRDALINEFSKPLAQRRVGTLVLDMPFGGRRDSDAFISDPDNAKLRELGVLFTPRAAGYTNESQLQASLDLADYLHRYLDLGDLNIPIANLQTTAAKVSSPDANIIQDVIALVKQAATQVIKMRDRGLVIEYKEDGSPCTNADVQAEAMIRDGLRSLGHRFIFAGEESREASVGGIREIVIDGIDGTRNFRDGNYGWCISIAGRLGVATEFAVIYDPISQEIYTAQSGQGAFIHRNGSVVRLVIPPSLPNDFSYSIGSFRVSGSTRIKSQITEDIKRLGGRGREWGCVALSICAVAKGGLGTFIQGNSKYHDHIAGILIAKESGAAVVEHRKTEGIADIIVSHPSLHQRVSEIVDRWSTNSPVA